MTPELTRTLKMKYTGKLERISCPVDANYDEIIGIAMERFEISSDFKDFLKISNEFGTTFQKDTFEYFLLLFPNPKIIFNIRVDYTGLLLNLHSKSPEPLKTRKNQKRRHSEDDDEYGCVPVTKQNCFIGTWPGAVIETEEPTTKKQKIDIKLRETGSKRTRSKRSIRI